MTSYELPLLLGTAASLGFIHTVLGPDHYLPFVALSKSRGWTMSKTLSITVLCGLGHIIGSVALGAIGISTGFALNKLEFIEGARGEAAAWLLIAFGLAYGAWGICRAIRNKPHTHAHHHIDGDMHEHQHTHHHTHAHPHDDSGRKLTGWTLFIIFILGPCEVLIPLLMFPAATLSGNAIALVAVVYGAVTVVTMTAMVFISLLGLRLISTSRLNRYSHAIAGTVIMLCGVAIQFGL